MNESLVDNQVHFERLSFQNVKVLIEVLRALKLDRAELIRKAYLDTASDFPEVTQFLDILGIINFQDKKIKKGPNYPNALVALDEGEDQLSEHLLSLILESQSSYAKELEAFIKQFEPDENGSLVLRNFQHDEHLFAVRNFLIGADAIEFDYSQTYTLGHYLEEIYPKVCYCSGMSPSELEGKQTRQAELGSLAEKEVVAYEKSQAGDSFKHLVTHVAEHNVSAGFDVYSVRSEGGQICQRRLIEVKAVRLADRRFYWTKCEREKAEQHKESYFLYLVPVEGDALLMDQMTIIQDPFNEVINNQSEWGILTDVIECRKKKQHVR